MKELSITKVCGGSLRKFSHFSNSCNCTMNFNIFIPPNPKLTLLFLSGLTCNEDNFMIKSGCFNKAAELGVAIVTPDTSPIDMPGDAENFGKGAGFYVDATKEPWNKHYKMYSYVLELVELVKTEFHLSHFCLSGHSMGGHGALMIALRNPGLFKSVSAFAPISNPMQCEWGIKAFTGYLGGNKEEWKEYDSSELVKNYNETHLRILIDQGSNDQFLHQLLPNTFYQFAKQNSLINLTYRFQEDYDHSYYFIQSFLSDHFHFHATE